MKLSTSLSARRPLESNIGSPGHFHAHTKETRIKKLWCMSMSMSRFLHMHQKVSERPHLDFA